MRRIILAMGGAAVLTAVVVRIRRRSRGASAGPMVIRESVEIERPLDEVFAYAADPENMPEWSGMVREVRREGQGPLEEGDRVTVFIEFLGRKFETPFEITSHQPRRRHSEKSTGGPFAQEHTRLFEETEAGATRVTEVARGEPGGYFRLAGPLLERVGRRQMRNDLAKLKDLLEAGS